MKNLIKIIGLLVIVASLLVNSFLLNKQVKQNIQIESDLMRIESAIRESRNVNSTFQNYQRPQSEAKEVMTPSELADYLRIDMDKVYELAENKASKIPHVVIDGEYRFSKAAINDWMKTTNEIDMRK
jgi:excisionase family DNA binding protein